MLGSVINQRYQIKTELGSGGMGVVYCAFDLLLEREVAIKALHRDVLDPESRSRLLREARAVAHLNHPNIVNVYDAGEVDGAPYIVMELVHGKSLRTLGSLSFSGLTTIFKQICGALDYAHSQGVVHRDIKPENILVEQSDGHLTAKLNDFGLALSNQCGRLTQQGTLMGTPFYMAPELIQGGIAGSQSDLYALGAVIYECATGRPPFTGDNLLSVLSQHINAPVVPASTFSPDIPPALDRLILHMLEKNPEDRLSVKQVQAVLDEIETSSDRTITPLKLTPLDRMTRGRLVGREKELGEAVAAWQKAEIGESCVLLISGEPGIGKTRFTRELITHAQFQGARVLLGECMAEGTSPYNPVAQMIEAAPMPPGLPPHAIACLITLTSGLAASYPDIVPNSPLEPTAELQRLSDSLTEWCRQLCQESPVLMVLDDAHWADSGTLALLRNLARRSARLQLKFMLVLTYREVELDETRALNETLYAFSRDQLSKRIKLARLDPDQTREMLAAMFNEEITPELLDAVYRETEGNPFFIEEVCKTLVEEGQVYRDGKGWSRLTIEQMEIPQSVRVAIQSRVVRLPDFVQETLKLASILGREFEYSLLQAVAGQDEESLIGAVEQAEHAQLIQEKQRVTREYATASLAYRFTHALIHTTLYESISGLRRQRLHRQVASALLIVNPENQAGLAYHYAQAGMSDEARVCYLAAGELALKLFAYQEAEKYFRLAIDLAGPPEDQARGVYGLGEALFAEGRQAEAMVQWKLVVPMYQNLGNSDCLARTYARLGRAAILLDDIEGSIALCEEGQRLVLGAPPSKGVATLFRLLGQSYSFRGFFDKAVSTWQEGLKIADEIDDRWEQSQLLLRLGFELAYHMGGANPVEGAKMISRAFSLAESCGCLEVAEIAQGYLGQIARDCDGDLQAALSHTMRAYEIAQRIGVAADELFELGLVCTVHATLGNMAELEALVQRGTYLMQMTETAGPGKYVFLCSQAALLYFQGKTDEARAILQEGFDEACRNKNAGYAGVTGYLLTLLLIVENDWVQAEDVLLRESQAAGGLMTATDYSDLAIVYSKTGRLAEAYAALVNAKTTGGENPISTEIMHMTLAEAELAVVEQRWETAWELFSIMTEKSKQAGMRFFEALFLRRWIAARVERGGEEDIREARRLLEWLIALFEGAGAVRLVEQANVQLKELK